MVIVGQMEHGKHSQNRWIINLNVYRRSYEKNSPTFISSSRHALLRLLPLSYPRISSYGFPSSLPHIPGPNLHIPITKMVCRVEQWPAHWSCLGVRGWWEWSRLVLVFLGFGTVSAFRSYINACLKTCAVFSNSLYSSSECEDCIMVRTYVTN